jgi:hypothetical protein
VSRFAGDFGFLLSGQPVHHLHEQQTSLQDFGDLWVSSHECPAVRPLPRLELIEISVGDLFHLTLDIAGNFSRFVLGWVHLSFLQDHRPLGNPTRRTFSSKNERGERVG